MDYYFTRRQKLVFKFNINMFYLLLITFYCFVKGFLIFFQSSLVALHKSCLVFESNVISNILS